MNTDRDWSMYFLMAVAFITVPSGITVIVLCVIQLLKMI